MCKRQCNVYILDIDNERYDVIMTDRDLLMAVVFQKEELEYLKKRYGVATDTIVKNLFPNDFANKKVQFSRIINKKSDDKHNLTALDLSAILADYFNKNHIRPNENQLTPTRFVAQRSKVECIGECMSSGEIRVYKGNEKKHLSVQPRFKNSFAVERRHGQLRNRVAFCKKSNQPMPSANYELSVVEQKKTKNLYWGYLIPMPNGKFNIEDFTMVEAKKTRDLITNIDINWSSRVLEAKYLDDEDWEIR